MTIFSNVNREWVQILRSQGGKDIWLSGGGELFRLLLEMNEVDAVEVTIVPALLGGGVALLPPPAHRTKLNLSSHKVYRSGLVTLIYGVQR